MDTQRMENYIREQVTKSGFPLEIAIYTCLEQHDWLPFSNNYYFDVDEKAEREIDITALPPPEVGHDGRLVDLTAPYTLDIELAIECKKSTTHAWVFFTAPTNSCYFYRGQTLDFIQMRTKNYESSFFDRILPRPDTAGLLHYSKFDRVATNYTEVKLQDEKGGPDQIFTACNQLTKFIAYSFQQSMRRIERSLSTRRVMIMFFPVIVFDGIFYEATLDANSSIVLARRRHLLLSRRSRWSFAPEEERSFLIDVVAKEHFEKYLESMRQNVSNLEESLVSKLGTLEID